jgi:hypothetical protein
MSSQTQAIEEEHPMHNGESLTIRRHVTINATNIL